MSRRDERDARPLAVVEDSPEDFITLERLLRRAGCERALVHFESGEKALAHLRPLGDAGARDALPCLVLLDLNLPGCGGLQVATELKCDPMLRHIPVVVLSTSAHDTDIESCYSAGVNAYVQKPIDLERYQESVRTLLAHWLGVVRLASGRAG